MRLKKIKLKNFRCYKVEKEICVDDLSVFIGKNDYPTIDEVKQLVFSYVPDWTFMVKDDIIRIYKKFKN